MRNIGFPFARLIITIISLMVSVGLLRSIVGHFQRNDVVGERQKILREEEARSRQLKDHLKEATSAAFIEKQAREKLGLAREGDIIVLMQSPTPPMGEKKKPENLSHWKRWWKLFF